MHVYPNYYKNFFLLLYIRMNGKNMNFDHKNIKKVTSTIKTKNI